MESESAFDRLADDWLRTLGISELSDWDVLVFLYRHRASLASAEHIARFLGYTISVVGDALDNLEFLGLIQRSRASRGVRLYLFLRSSALPPDSLEKLLSMAEDRNGRLLLAQQLRQRAIRKHPADSGSHRVGQGSSTWPKAI